MRSFAIWYDKKNKDYVSDVRADIHVNFWSQLIMKVKQIHVFLILGLKLMI